MKKEYTINGKNFSNRKGFYKEIQNQLTLGLTWEIGQNFNALRDVLSGGFGQFDCEEKIILRWRHFKRSERLLDRNFLAAIITFIEEQPHIEFIKE